MFYICIHLLNIYLLSFSHVPGTILGSSVATVKKAAMLALAGGAHVRCQKDSFAKENMPIKTQQKHPHPHDWHVLR